MKDMKISAMVVGLIIFLTTPGIVFASNYADINNNISASSNSGNGGNSSNTVSISNNVNTGNTNKSTSKSSTSIEMHQSGSGTSRVSVNGKTYELNGAGDISVNEISDSDSKKTPTITPTITPTSEPTPAPEVKGVSTGTGPFSFMVQFFNSLRNFFAGLFKH